jgi:hypothetical protein
MAMLDSEDKYHKSSSISIYRTRAQPLLCILILPAAATVTTDVWLQTDLISSSFGYDIVLAITNVSGAFFDGFFSAWESGLGKHMFFNQNAYYMWHTFIEQNVRNQNIAVPSGAKTEALHLIADDMRAFGLSTYTSWAGMVGVAAAMAHARFSALVGIMYILLTIVCAFVAHGELL